MHALAALLLIQSSTTPHAKVELIAENTAIAPGESTRIGVRVTIYDGWHIYWKNPGDSGIPTKIDWRLPKGWRASDMKWPAPKAIEADGMVSFGYEESVLFMTRIVAPANAKIGSSIDVTADVDFLICKESCLPGSAEPALKLKVADPALIQPSRWAHEFEKTAFDLPRSTRDWQLTATLVNGSVELTGNPSASVPETTSARFFGADSGVFENNAILPVTRKDLGYARLVYGFSVTIPISPYASTPPTRLTGILAGFGPHSYEIDIPITN